MKHFSLTWSARAFAIGAIAVASTVCAQTTVRISSWHPPKHPGITGGYQPFIDYVENATDGSLNFRLWTGGSLLGPRDTLPGVRNDIADIGMLALTYFPAEFPYAQLIANLSMLSDNPAAAAAATSEFVALECAPCREEYSRQDLVFTSAYATTPYVMISKQELTSPEALKGKTFRSGGALWERWTDYVGGTPVNVASSEIFEALDRGGLDVALFSPSGLQSFSLWDVASYVNMLPLGNYAATSLFTLNQGFWKGLKKDERRAILDGAAVGAIGVTYGYISSSDKALEMAASHGVKIEQPGPALKKQLKDFIRDDRANAEALATQQYGIENPGKWIDKYQALLKKWERIVAENDGDQQKMVDAMQKQIYARIDVDNYGL